MHFRSVNVTIRPRQFLPWMKQLIQVDGDDTFEIKRRFHFFSLTTCIQDLKSREQVIKIRQPRAHKTVFEVTTPSSTFTIRKVSYWQWECRCKDDIIMINRLGAVKCVLSEQGKQLAIMSLNTNLPFVEDRNTYLRVNSESYLHLSIAAALIVKGFGINLNPLFLNNNKLSPIRSVELV